MTQRRVFKLPGQNGEVGLKCPRCGCTDLRAKNTYDEKVPGILRRRQCRHCKKIVFTNEVIIEEAPTDSD